MRYAIIPAAGSGTRMKELGKNYAKTVLPYEGKPIIIHIIESLLAEVAPDEIIIVYGNEDHKQQLQQVVEIYGLTVTFKPVIPIGRVGPAQSIASGIPRGVTEQDSLFIHLSDFVTVDRTALQIPPDSIAAFPVEDQHRWCMVGQNPIQFYDKPKDPVPTNLAVAGLYHISNAKDFLLSYLYNTSNSSGESQISEILSAYNNNHPLTVEQIAPNALKDFGTIEEFIQNRGISKTRSFNKIIANQHTIEKYSSDRQKMYAEYNWYGCLPDELVRFTPRAIRFIEIENATGYILERLKSTNLRDLYLYLDRSEETWNEVFESAYEFIDQCRDPLKSNSFWEYLFEKNYARVKGTEYEQEAIDFLNGLHAEIKESRFYNETTPYHGDMHFANMFYCFHYKQLKLIDPNGRVMGHWLYDVAKLNHSVLGKYDWIDAELYHDNGFMDKGCEGVSRSFSVKILHNLGLTDDEIKLVNKLTASLFLTMIPLHNHSKKNQELFLAEFRRLRG